ncbi:MAG: magnesium-translocating P-type ATPase [Candidatus Nanoarchaeia archaeon]|nr:magnesium-translocating P-type ATPase [Candidatus Nanoarchaeia archaeon]
MLVNQDYGYYASLKAGDVLKKLDSSPKGLSHEEVKERIKEYGINSISSKKKKHIVLEYLSHFSNPLMITLIVVSLISVILKEPVNASIIALMVFLSVTLEFVLEHKAQKAVEKLREIVKITATVIRNGKQIEVKKEDLCIGDIILLSAGDLVPADARLISAKDLFIKQSALTGESFPAEKNADITVSKDSSLIEMKNIVFLGTSVVSGSATAIVIKTGMNTEFGKIAQKIFATEVHTEFEHGISNFSYLVMKSTIVLVLLIFFINALLHRDIIESLLFSIAVAVGLTPELLPVIMSINMANGSRDMAKKGAIVKKLSSIPNFGSMDILCTDKTGTLTEDKIKLIKYTDVNGKNADCVFLNTYINSYFQTGIKNQMDEAVLNFKKIDIKNYKKIDEIPYDFIRKRMSIVVEKSKKRYLITKGAPEEIFNICKFYYINGKKLKLTSKIIKKIRKKYYDLSKDGYRVLAVAVKQVHKKDHNYEKEDEFGMELYGFVSFLDPAKKDVKNILVDLERAGIEIKIITGDNELVTKKICNDIKLKVKGVLLGTEIDHLTNDALKVKVENTTIFARFSPYQKDRIINALKANGHVVGYLGDGINDTPSFKAADISISVNSAVDVAKETADIVLTHKSLKELKEGVLEGRKTFGNTLKYIMMQLSSNFGNMFSVVIAAIFLPFLPMLPVQILLNNFLYDASQVTIPTDNIDKEFIKKPKRWNINFIKNFMILLGPVSSIYDILTFIVLYFILRASIPAFQTGWFMESLASQTLVIHIIRTKQTPFFKSNASKYLYFTTILCTAIGWIIPYTKLGSYFGFVPLPFTTVMIIVGIVLVYFITVQIAKNLFYRKYDI